GTIYLGVSQKTPDKALYVTTANALSGDMGSSNYVVNAHAPAIDEWQEIVAYIKGRSAGAASGSGSKTSPRTVSQQAGFITPMFIANYSAQTGIVELDYLILEDAEAIVGNDANASAISALDTKVSEVDGRLTTATNSITSLNSRMSAAEGNISAANSALSGLSTRMTAAENGLTNQSNAITNLSNSLTVTTNTANAALPKIQGGTGAAKLFRGVLVWQQNGANLTGNIVIQTPITFTNKMFRLSLTGYNYLAAKNEINLNIGGYAYSGTSLLQHGVVNSGTMPIRVRMGVRNGTVVVILTSQAPGAYWQYPKFNIDAEIGYTTPPDSWADGWSASFMAEADLASNGISAIIEPSLLDISTTLNATASAISNLTNTVSQQGDTITSHSNSITTLTNKITNNDLSNLVLNPDFVDPKSDWTSGVIVDATDAAPNPPSAKALRLNNRDSYYGPFVKCNVGDMFYVSAWFATPNTSATASAVLGFNTRNSAGTYTWYSVAIKSTDKNAWGMVEGYFTVPNGMVDIRPWLQVSIAASEAAGQQWHVTNIQVRNITGNKKLATDLQATSSALSTLDSKVANIDGRVTSASNNIVSLNNSVTNINATLAQKADATALNSLSNRVTTTEGAITSQGSSITSLNASVNGLLKDVAVSDTRSTNQPPSWYWSNYPLRIVREFKQASVLGLTGMGTYVSLETYVYWTDASGGPIIQIARGTDSKLTAERRSTSTSTWGSWTQDIKTLSDGLANKAEASAVNTLDAKVSTIDGKVSTQASNIVSLQTAVGGNTSAISEQSKSIDGIRNIKTITIDNNGVMSGYGLISDLVNGKVTSTFGVNADNFYIGPPSGGKKPFLVTTTNTTVNGVTYPPGTWIDTAYIATASIKSAHIQDAAITTAKIADAAIDTAKIKDAAITNAKIADLTVDTIKIKDNAITVATVAENTQASKILTPSSSTFDACQVTVVTSGTNFVKIDVSPFLYAWNKYSSPQIYLDIYRDDTLIKTFNLPWIQSTEVFKDRSWTEGGSYDVLYNIVVYTMNTMAGSMFTTLDRPAAGTHVYKATLRRTTNWGRDNAMDMARRYNEIEFTNALILITEVKK
ncbi:hypothetical protein ACUIHG_002620, partial [Acinetobacter baumannii]